MSDELLGRLTKDQKAELLAVTANYLHDTKAILGSAAKKLPGYDDLEKSRQYLIAFPYQGQPPLTLPELTKILARDESGGRGDG